MAQVTVDSILQRAAADANFRNQLLTEPEAALAPYVGQLSEDELAALSTLHPALFQSMTSVVAAAQADQPWYRPASFKELGGAFLSVVLLLLMLYAAMRTFSMLNAAPLIVDLGDSKQVIDTFDRAKEALNIFFPLFSAVVTFWLGVAIESRRADRNEEEAAVQRQERQQAEAITRAVRHDAETAMAEIESATLRSMTQQARGGGRLGGTVPPGSGLENNEGGGGGAGDLYGYEEILTALARARSRLRR